MKVVLKKLTQYKDTRHEQMVQYTLSEEETKIFINILLRDPHSPHTPFILVLFKELDYDMPKMLRVVNVGYKTNNLLRVRMLDKVLALVREAVVIKDIEFRNALDETTITQLSRTTRYKDMGIGRSTIYKTIHKHGLDHVINKR